MTFVIFTSARTSLPCRFGCSLPSTDTIPLPSIVGRSNEIKLYDSVTWNECESIYVLCPFGFVIATYNSFIDYVHVYNINNSTVYCGKYDQNYYMLYNNEKGRKKLCSNTFDRINCIGLSLCWLLLYHLKKIL